MGSVLVLLGALCASLEPAVLGEDLARAYPATLDYVDEEEAEPLQFLCGPEDVWSLNSLTLDFGRDLSVRLGRGQLVIGQHLRNALWAVYLPDRPAKLTSVHAAAGEEVRHVWLRFHPASIGELFPARTVRGPGNGADHVWGYRVYAWKIDGSWSKENQPIIPPRGVLIADFDTTGGLRRHFRIDLATREVSYSEHYVAHALPDSPKVDSKTCAAVLDAAWSVVEQYYPHLSAQAGVDWSAQRQLYKRRAAEAGTRFDAAILVRSLLEPLGDGGLWVRCDREVLVGFDRRHWRPISWAAIREQLGKLESTGMGVVWAKTTDGIGYIRVPGPEDARVVEAFDKALSMLGNARGLLLDLRSCAGGEEALAARIAGRFSAERRVYGSTRARDGSPGHGLGEPDELAFEPRAPSFRAPLHVLLGPATGWGGERLSLMLLAVPGAAASGGPTAGLGLEADWYELPEGLAVFMPVGVDFDAAGEPLYGKGITTARTEPSADKLEPEKDALLEAALADLRAALGPTGAAAGTGTTAVPAGDDDP